ncbi:ComEC/Rec2 family competence protein [Nocardia rhizosphaerae]|uniref:ComEC/Rec2 family competence protein n=1 Tax=Nocardia rhizosphaerae TaxID=1691571 RepID=A0ABV8L9P3_9NOCA
MRAANDAAVVERARQVLDMRLVPAAVACWVATIVAVSVGWTAGVALAIGAVVLAIGLWVVLLWAIAHERERWRVVAVVGLATMLLGAGFAAAGAWREHQVQSHPLRESFGRSVTVLATVTDDAKPLRASGFGGQRRWIVQAGLQEFGGGSAITRAGGTVVILASDARWANLSPGQVIRFRARVTEPNRADLTVATLNAVATPERIGMPPWWQRAATAVRSDLAAAAARALPPDAAGLLPALVVGDTSALSVEVRDTFEIAGLQHLCVVSGANFTILLTALLALTRLLTAGPRMAAAGAAGVVVLFVVLARPDPSVLRAAAMGAVTVLALLTGRRKQALPALCAAVIGLLGVAPQLAVSAGFALSVLATAGLILLAPSWADWLRARGWWRAPAEVLAVSAAAFVVTVPLMVALSGRVSVVAILANALVAPVVGVITVIGAVGTVVACLWADAAVPVLWCARPPLRWLLWVAEQAAAIPGAMATVPSGAAAGVLAAAIMVAVVACLSWAKTRRLLTAAVLGVAMVLVPVRLWHPGWPPDGWVLAMCDVGQGDGLALSAGPGSAVVVDTGPDPRAMRRCLNELRIDRIPLLVLTHPHADHIDGLAGALRGRTVDAIATAPGELRTSGGVVAEQSSDCPAFVPRILSGRVTSAGQSAEPLDQGRPPDREWVQQHRQSDAEIRPAGPRAIDPHGSAGHEVVDEHRPAGSWWAGPRRSARGGLVDPAGWAGSVGLRRSLGPGAFDVRRSSGSAGHEVVDEHRPAGSWWAGPRRSARGGLVDPAGWAGSAGLRRPLGPGTVDVHRSSGPAAVGAQAGTRWVGSRSPASSVWAGTRLRPGPDSADRQRQPGKRVVRTVRSNVEQTQEDSPCWGFGTEAEGRSAGRAAREGSASGSEGDGIERVRRLAESARIPLMELHAGLELRFGAMELTVLAPGRESPSGFDLDEANDRSLVLKARTAAGTVLLTGDIEGAAQSRLLGGGDLRADILKVPHHGSRTTTPEFLRAVRPRLALISSGSDNTFGHPHPAVVTALAALGATVARTDQHGDIVVLGPAAELRTVTSRRRRPARLTPRRTPSTAAGRTAADPVSVPERRIAW